MPEFKIRKITERDDAEIAKIIRHGLEEAHLDIPGTAYFDPELENLSRYYSVNPDKRAYFIMTDEKDKIVGGIGLAEFNGFEDCAKGQKLYLSDDVKCLGLGRRLFEQIEIAARDMGYKNLYLETHSNLGVAIGMYERHGYKLIDKPACVKHSTMDRFFIKAL